VTLLNVLALVVLLAVVGFVVGKWAFGKDTEVENRRRSAAKLAGILSGMGLVKTPDFLIDYSVGDYSGMATHLKSLVDLFLNGEEAVTTEFAKVFDNVLVAKLKTEAGRVLVAAKLADAAKASDPSVVASAPTARVA
jgi:hypothetical protein